jgi:hypothetical protein
VIGLLQQAVLREELDRPVAGTVMPHLQPAHETEAVLEPDLRARVEAEEVRGQIAEIALSERPPNRWVTRKALLNFGSRSVVGRFTTTKSGCERLKSRSGSSSLAAGAAGAALRERQCGARTERAVSSPAYEHGHSTLLRPPEGRAMKYGRQRALRSLASCWRRLRRSSGG